MDGSFAFHPVQITFIKIALHIFILMADSIIRQYIFNSASTLLQYHMGGFIALTFFIPSK
jgi:hypothetical protein